MVEEVNNSIKTLLDNIDRGYVSKITLEEICEILCCNEYKNLNKQELQLYTKNCILNTEIIEPSKMMHLDQCPLCSNDQQN